MFLTPTRNLHPLRTSEEIPGSNLPVLMALVDEKSGSDGKVWSFCRIPFWQNGNASSSASPPSTVIHNRHLQSNGNKPAEQSSFHQSGKVSSIAKSLLPNRRRLRLDPSNKLYFPYEPGKQVKSAIEIKNTSKTHVAFKFQTTAPKSCYMRPPGGILAPGESIIATVFKFVEPPENNEKPVDRRRVKFKIVSLKVKGEMDYVPELFDEQKDQVAVEQILQVVFLDPELSSPALEKLSRQLAEAEAATEVRQKPAEETGPKIVGEGLVIDEWKERRERYLAKQQVGGVDLV